MCHSEVKNNELATKLLLKIEFTPLEHEVQAVQLSAVHKSLLHFINGSSGRVTTKYLMQGCRQAN
jgi:hypothetical protein